MKLDRTDEILRRKLHDAEFTQGLPSWDEFQPKMNRRSVVRKLLPYVSSAAVAASVALVLWLNNTTINQGSELQIVEQQTTLQNIETTTTAKSQIESLRPPKSQLAYSVQGYAKDVVVDQALPPSAIEPTSQAIIQNENAQESSAKSVSAAPSSQEEPSKYSTSRATAIYEPENAKQKRKRSRKLLAMTPYFSVGSSMSGSNAVPDRIMSSAMVNNFLSVQMGQYKQTVDFSQSDYTHNFPLSFGVEFDFALSDRFSVGSGIVYSYLKSTAQVEQRFVYKHTQKVHYLGVPVNVSYKITGGRRLDVYAKLGAMAELSVTSSAQTDIYQNDKFLSSESVNVSAEGVQMSINAGVGLNVHLSPRVGIYVEPGLSHYFKNSNHPTTYYSNSQPQFNLRAGLKFQF